MIYTLGCLSCHLVSFCAMGGSLNDIIFVYLLYLDFAAQSTVSYDNLFNQFHYIIRIMFFRSYNIDF